MPKTDNLFSPWEVQEEKLNQIQKQFFQKFNKVSNQSKNRKQQQKMNTQEVQQKRCLLQRQQLLNTTKYSQNYQKPIRIKTISNVNLQHFHSIHQPNHKLLQNRSVQNFKRQIINLSKIRSSYSSEKKLKQLKQKGQIQDNQKFHLILMKNKIKPQKIEQILIKKTKRLEIMLQNQNQNQILKRYSVKNIYWEEKKRIKIQEKKNENKNYLIKRHILDKLFSQY